MRTAFIIGAVVVGLAGCGGGTVDIDADQSNVCGEIAEVGCHNLYQCCTEGEIERTLGVGEPRTEVQCTDDLRRSCDRAIATRDFSIKAGRARFDAQVMNTCLNALVAPEETCTDVVTELPWADACMNEAWVGTVEDGGTCFFGHDCASEDSFCATNQTCTPRPGVGQPCGAGCAGDLFCSLGTCQPQLGAGSPCTSQNQCIDPLFCDFGSTTPTCTAQAAGGEACTSSAGCESGQCIPGTCAGTNNGCFRDADCLGSGHCADDQSLCSQDSQCNPAGGTCSIVTTQVCSQFQPCGIGQGTCVFPVACIPGDCVGEPVCTSTQITVDYCTGSLGQLPIP